MCKRIYKHLAASVAKEMIRELEKNQHKGDRENWANLKPMELVKEIYYHTGKLQNAVKDNNKDQIREYCADIANMTGMVMDVTKVINLDTISPIKKSSAKFNDSSC